MVQYETLPDTTRVWIYQSSRPFTDAELPALRSAIERFVDSWVSHDLKLRAFGDIFHQQFIVLMVDESQAGASGCSIDKSVKFLQQVEAQLRVDLFDRLTFAYKDGDQVHTLPKDDFIELYEAGKLTDDTLVFDNLVHTKSDFEKGWVKPLRESWHARML